jgi:hypothetical protein
MSEIWLRNLRREGIDATYPLQVWQESCWKELGLQIRRTFQAAGCEAVLRLPESPTPSTTPERLSSKLRAMPARRLRDLMLVLFLPADGDNNWAKWARGLLRLVVLYPEVCFRFVTDGTVNAVDFDNVCDVAPSGQPESYAFPKASETIANFLAGYREWFDPVGVRRTYRHSLWKKKGANDELPLQGAGSTATSDLLPAWIVEDEREYAELLAYVAYRSGKYAPEIIAGQQVYESRLTPFIKNAPNALVIHAYQLPFLPFAGKSTDDLRKEWLNVGSNGAASDWLAWRMMVTGARQCQEKFTLVRPTKWKPSDRWPKNFGWSDSHEIRGLQKPLPWIHDLLESGLYPAAGGSAPSTCGPTDPPEPSAKGIGPHRPAKSDRLDDRFFDGIAPSDVGGGHSAPDEAQEIADSLLDRARECIDTYLPVTAAVLALDALRTLRGHSATLFVDALALLCDAEVRVELEVGSAAGGAPKRSTQLRAQEVRDLLRHVEEKGLLPEGMRSASLERLWTALRQRFLGAGAFEAADEALMEVHRARGDRWRRQWRTRITAPLKGCTLWLARLMKNAPDALRWAQSERKSAMDSRRGSVHAEPGEALGRILQQRHMFRRRLRGLLHIAVPLGLALDGFLLVNEHVMNSLRSGYTALVVPLLVFVGVSWAFIGHPDWSGWVVPAVRPSRWLLTAILSILVLSAGNTILFAGPSPSTFQSPVAPSVAAHRCRSVFVRAVDACLWTCGNSLGSQTLPETLNAAPLADEEINFKVGDIKHNSLAQSVLWLENVFTGWILFAFGLSAIYRKATRG